MKCQEAYVVYDDDENIIGVTLSLAEAAFQVWEEFTASLDEDAKGMYLADYGYDSWEDFEEDWYSGFHDWNIGGFYFEEYPLLNELGFG